MEDYRFSYSNDPLPLVTQFENVFHRLLKREQLDLYDLGVSLMFEIIAANLMEGLPGREWMYYDGVNSLESHVRKAQQVKFTGEMWVGDDNRRQWKEALWATVTDKRVTKQGIWIVLQIGGDRVEGELAEAFGQASK